jgi:hypothetical protein
MSLGKALNYCREWLKENVVQNDSQCNSWKPNQVINGVLEFIESDELQAKVASAQGNVRSQLNFLVDVLQEGDDEE